jgi:hypothetical protein
LPQGSPIAAIQTTRKEGKSHPQSARTFSTIIATMLPGTSAQRAINATEEHMPMAIGITHA